MQKLHDKLKLYCKIFAIKIKSLIHLQLARSGFRYYLCAHLKPLYAIDPFNSYYPTLHRTILCKHR